MRRSWTGVAFLRVPPASSSSSVDGMTFRIRAAQPKDKRAVRALCARIWSDDYIPSQFDDWVRDRRGKWYTRCTALVTPDTP